MTTSFYELIGLAVLYARVSTTTDGQKDSCKNQLSLGADFLIKHSGLICAGEYVDDGITGATNYRPAFNDMIERIKCGDIRYIITKNEERLCRSTEIDGYLQSICREYDVCIIFLESDTIFNPFDNEQVTMHGFKAVMNQQYVFHQSKVGTLAHQQKCKDKRLDATDVRFGFYWNKEEKCIMVHEEEGPIVYKMFEWYIFRGLGVNEIARKLADMGVRGSRSGKMLSASTISSMLADERYCGIFYINKKGSKLTIGMNVKKIRFNRPRDEWVAVPGPAIISKEWFDLAQRIREERQHVYDCPNPQGRFKGIHLFAGKVFCGDCGTQYHFLYTDRAKTIGAYKDYFGKTQKALTEVCNNKDFNRIYEDTLIALCKYSIQKFLNNHKTCIDNLINIIRKASVQTESDSVELKGYEKRLVKLDKELKKTLLAYRDAPDADMKEAFLQMYKESKAEKESVETKIHQFMERRKKAEDIEKNILEIREHIEKIQKIEVFDRTVVENFIDRIIVNADGSIAIILKFSTTYEALLKPEVANNIDEDIPYLNESAFRNLQFITNISAWKESILRMSARCSNTAPGFS